MKIKNIKHKKYPAFSFLEVVISIFIFSLVILTATAIFSKVILARKSAKQIQNDVDTAKIVVDMVAKNIQMSSGLTCSDGTNNSCSEIYFFSNSQKVCMKYRFDSFFIKVLASAQAEPGDPSDPAYPNCNPMTSEPYSGLVAVTPAGMDTTGKFIITPTDKTSSPKVIGKGTILLIIDGKYNLQTTVSFREYDGTIY